MYYDKIMCLQLNNTQNNKYIIVIPNIKRFVTLHILLFSKDKRLLSYLNSSTLSIWHDDEIQTYKHL